MAVYKKHGSKYWWFEFRFSGRRIQQSSKSENRREAENIEKAAWTQLARGEVGIKEKPKPERVSIGVLLDRLTQHYQLHGKDSVQTLSHLKRARADFGSKMADVLTSEDVTRYQEKRKRQGDANATINRTLEIVRRSYNLAGLNTPKIGKLEETNVRQGFFSADQFERVLAFLPEDLHDFSRFAFLTGMRLGEIKSLSWNNVSENTIRLRGVDAKSGKPRTIVCTGELADLLKRRQEARAVKTPSGVVIAGNIFHRNGLPVGEFRRSWKTACRKAGCPEKLFHDFRRTGVRNMVRAGVPQNIAMKISGHRTDATFRRYDICNEDDLAQAMLSLERYHKAEQRNVVAISKNG